MTERQATGPIVGKAPPVICGAGPAQLDVDEAASWTGDLSRLDGRIRARVRDLRVRRTFMAWCLLHRGWPGARSGMGRRSRNPRPAGPSGGTGRRPAKEGPSGTGVGTAAERMVQVNTIHRRSRHDRSETGGRQVIRTFVEHEHEELAAASIGSMSCVRSWPHCPSPEGGAHPQGAAMGRGGPQAAHGLGGAGCFPDRRPRSDAVGNPLGPLRPSADRGSRPNACTRIRPGSIPVAEP